MKRAADNSAEDPKGKKFAGAATYTSKFKDEWLQKYKGEVQGGLKDSEFRCTICNDHYNCAHQGVSDVDRHIRSKVHIHNLKAVKPSAKLESLRFLRTML